MDGKTIAGSRTDSNCNRIVNNYIPFQFGSKELREAFKKKNNDETYGKFHIFEGVSAGGHFPYVITKDFKCTESHFKHF